MKIAWYGKHFGEEPPLVGKENQGAGAIFFSGCDLRCVFCQNHQISQGALGRDYAAGEVAGMMMALQNDGAANIDLVTPNIWRGPLKEAIRTARGLGLNIPVVWNSNACESVGALRELEGLIDIYLPDFKYGDDRAAEKYSRAPGYARVAEAAIREMCRQAGRLRTENGLAKRGVIVRHLILPHNLPNTFSVLKKIAAIDRGLHLSLMSQYYPVFRAREFPELACAVSREEIEAAEKKKQELGLHNGWTQEEGAGEIFLPDFTRDNPFT